MGESLCMWHLMKNVHYVIQALSSSLQGNSSRSDHSIYLRATLGFVFASFLQSLNASTMVWILSSSAQKVNKFQTTVFWRSVVLCLNFHWMSERVLSGSEAVGEGLSGSTLLSVLSCLPVNHFVTYPSLSGWLRALSTMQAAGSSPRTLMTCFQVGQKHHLRFPQLCRLLLWWNTGSMAPALWCPSCF